MSNFFISTDTMTRASRASVLATQAQLARKQTEVASGKISDVGIQIGHRASELVALRHTLAASSAQQGANAITASRLESSQGALTNIGRIAHGFLGAVLAARGSAVASDQLGSQARTAMSALADRLNTNTGGEFLFAGINTGEAPVVSYFAAAGNAARNSILQAFQAKFGVLPTDPDVVDITPEDMSNFISNELASQFADAAWSANWSTAASQTPTAMIGPFEQQEVGASANEPPFRQLAQAIAMVVDLGGTALKDATRAVVLQKATELAGGAQAGISSVASRLGLTQQRIEQANEQLSLKVDIVTRQLSALESADPYTTATDLNELMRRLEASYATTARIQNLSLLAYL